MKIIKHFIINSVSLYVISQFISGMTFTGGIMTLILTGVVLTITTFLIKPLVNVLLLPINLVTFGLFKGVAYAITLYLVTLLVSGFNIQEFNYAGYSSYWFNIPAIYLTGVLAFLAYSFLISAISSFFSWLMK